MGQAGLDEHIKRFFDGPRWYNSDAPRCESRVIIHGAIFRCECAGVHKYHAYVTTRRLASAADCSRLRAIGSDIEEVW